MRIVIQRVTQATVTINGEIHSHIGRGLAVLVGVEKSDTPDDARWLAAKTTSLRIFPDEQGIMNRSLTDTGGEILAVSQFTLTASTRRGNRPSYIRAAAHPLAIDLYRLYCSETERITGRKTITGVFGEDMKVALVNDGPVTIIIDSHLRE